LVWLWLEELQNGGQNRAEGIISKYLKLLCFFEGWEGGARRKAPIVKFRERVCSPLAAFQPESANFAKSEEKPDSIQGSHRRTF
ncbi:MAG TPA: hypothetical protein VFW62_11010, partial [bacterium]|nr:hypothetical protein [bacterium]